MKHCLQENETRRTLSCEAKYFNALTKKNIIWLCHIIKFDNVSHLFFYFFRRLENVVSFASITSSLQIKFPFFYQL